MTRPPSAVAAPEALVAAAPYQLQRQRPNLARPATKSVQGWPKLRHLAQHFD
jgi:hypothetical protein